MRLPVLIIIVSGYGLLSCVSKPAKESVSQNLIAYDSSNIAIIPLDTTGHRLFNKNYKPTNLSTAELLLLDSLLTIFIADYQGKRAEDKVGHAKIDFPASQYQRQYVPVVTSTGEKKVWVNCFCRITHPNWRSEIVSVADGGSCFFNLTINLTQKTYSFFIVNSEA